MRAPFLFKKNSRGFTLPEMIVAMAVLGTFIVMAMGTVVPGFKITQQAEESVYAQREVVLTFDRLVAEMSQLDRASVSTADEALSFLSDKPFGGGGPPIADAYLQDLAFTSPDRVWRKHVVLRRRNGHLLRREFRYDKGNEMFRINPDDLPSVADASGVGEKIFTKNVELFEAEASGKSRVYIKVRSVFRGAAKPTASELTLQVQMRGGT